MYNLAELIKRVAQFTRQDRMSSGKKRERVLEFLKAPFRHHRSRSPGPSPASASIPSLALSKTPNTTLLSNVISESSSSADNGISSPADATEDQSPNPQSLAICIPVKNEAFQKAIQEYIDNLSDDDKEAFQSATDVMEKIGELQHDKSRTPSSNTTRLQKVQKVLQCVRLFLGSIATCIQQIPEISSLVVGGLNCILTVGYLLLISLFRGIRGYIYV